jgi:exosortase C (VPDSG-CTERM-specific)
MQAENITFVEKKPDPGQPSPKQTGAGNRPFGQGRGYLPALVLLLVCFGVPLGRLALFALHDDLYSYILLLPFVSWYLIRLKPPQTLVDSKPLRGLGAIFLLAGLAVGGAYLLREHSNAKVAMEDYLSANMLAFYLCFLGVNFIFLRKTTLWSLAYPIGMLVFIIPMPVALRDGVQTFLQYGSAYCADGMFRIAGMTFVRDELIFHLPGISIKVAPECSGIHSSYILLITSLLAGYLFLRSPWRRALLTAVVLPLALVRNGFRVFTIGELCVHISPKMIDSPIHHQGGPLFFVLSLIPFFMLLAWLRRAEQPRKPIGPQPE